MADVSASRIVGGEQRLWAESVRLLSHAAGCNGGAYALFESSAHNVRMGTGNGRG